MKDVTLEQSSAGSIATASQPLDLRPQQRMARGSRPNDELLLLSQGMLAIDASPVKGQRQILDFLMPGDLLPLTIFMPMPNLSVRAITAARIVPAECAGEPLARGCHDTSSVLLQHQRQLSRALAHHLMIGHLEAEMRVASGLLTLALRNGGDVQSGLILPLPMSRDDIADYLAMNRDTLSRIMMRLESLGVIMRVNRHTIRIPDLARLASLSPIAPQIQAACTAPTRGEAR